MLVLFVGTFFMLFKAQAAGDYVLCWSCCLVVVSPRQCGSSNSKIYPGLALLRRRNFFIVISHARKISILIEFRSEVCRGT